MRIFNVILARWNFLRDSLYSAARAMLNVISDILFSRRFQMAMGMLLFFAVGVFAQSSAGDYTAGTSALTTVTQEIVKYVPVVQKLIYAIAGIVVLVGAISIFAKMNNEEQDVKKSILMILFSCIFLVAAAQALPLFFGIGGAK